MSGDERDWVEVFGGVAVDVMGHASAVAGGAASVAAVIWKKMVVVYEQASRREEFRQIKGDTRIAAGIAELRGVQVLMHERLIDLREEAGNHEVLARKHMSHGNHTEARAYYQMKVMYEAQVVHAQNTMTAIETHIICLEATAINRRVARALRAGTKAGAGEDDWETASSDVADEMHEYRDTTARVMQVLAETPPLVGDAEESELDEEMRLWMMEAPPELVFPKVPTHELANKNIIDKDSPISAFSHGGGDEPRFAYLG